MANATLSALISEFQQYGDFPFIGSDAVNRLHDVIVSVTGGAINPPLDHLGNNHTYWLVLAIQFLSGNSIPAFGSLTIDSDFSNSVFKVSFSPSFSSRWGIYIINQGTGLPVFFSKASGVTFTLDPNISNEFLVAQSALDANTYWEGPAAVLSDSVLDVTGQTVNPSNFERRIDVYRAPIQDTRNTGIFSEVNVHYISGRNGSDAFSSPFSFGFVDDHLSHVVSNLF